jgi:dihydrofolate reductase
MRKLVSSINITLDGFCNHTAVIADDELHQNANELLRNADTILFGRITYQLMEEGWPPLVKEPTGNKPMDDFAVLIDNIPKIVFSRTLKTVDWKNTKLGTGDLAAEVLKLKMQPGKNILVGGPSMIIQLMELDLIDEFQFCVQPIILGSGLQLFKHIKNRINLRLLNTKTHGSGAVTIIYERMRDEG